MFRRTVYLLTLVLASMGCDFDRFDSLPDVTGFAYTGSCLCAICSDRPFCQYQHMVTGEIRYEERSITEVCPLVHDPMSGEVDPNFVQIGFSTPTRWFTDQNPPATVPVHCIDPDGAEDDTVRLPEVRVSGTLPGETRDIFCNALSTETENPDIVDFANVECADLDRDCERIGATGCADPAPEVTACVLCNGSLCDVCDFRETESATHPQALSDAIGKLNRTCGELDPHAAPFGGQPVFVFPPRRLCFASCLRTRDVVECNPTDFDPPQRSLPAVPATAAGGDARTNGVNVRIADSDGILRLSQDSRLVGQVLLSAPRCGPGDTCTGEVSDVTGRTIDPFVIDGRTVTEIRVGNSEIVPVSITPISSSRSLISSTDGALFFLAADISGVGAKGASFDPGRLGGSIDWDTRVFSVTTVLTGAFEGGTIRVGMRLTGQVPNVAPDADAGPDRLEECSQLGGSRVTLSAAGSSDPDGLTDISSYVWNVSLGGEPVSRGGPEAEMFLPLGVHEVGLSVRDRARASTGDDVVITVADTEPPVFDAIELASDCFWPPDHRMRLFRLGHELNVEAHDVCEGEPADVRIVSVTSNQADDGLGDGRFAPDVRFGSGAFCVRSERTGTDLSAREYIVTLETSDFGGRAQRDSVVVRVPHDLRPSERCIGDADVPVVEDGDPRCMLDVPARAAAPSTSSTDAEPSRGTVGGGCSAGGRAPAPLAVVLVLLTLLRTGRRRQ